MSRARPIWLAISLGGVLYGVADAATVRHAEPLLGFSVDAANADARGSAPLGADKPTAAGPTVISFNAFSRDFALELEPNGRLAGLVQRVGTAAYRGKIAGRPDSWVRLVLTPEGPSGLVFDGETLYGIEAGDDAPLGGGAPAMFRLEDVYFAPGELGCEVGAAAAIDGEQAVAAMAQEFTALAAAAATRRLDLGTVADFEFSQAFGANAESELLARFNNVDGIFSEQVGVQISVRDVDIFTASDDPFTASGGSALLDELANYRGGTPSQDALGLTHLFTGRDLDGMTAGVAFSGVVCATRRPGETRSFGVGLTEARRGTVIDSLFAAHEIGHNFGAPHDNQANTACSSTPPTFLMAPNVGPSNNRFSACSIEQMQAEIAAATCLARIGPADMRVLLPQPAQVFAGVSFTQMASVENDGADEATGVVLTATAESGLAIEEAAVGGASCTVAPGSATCPLGAVGGGAARNVTLTLRAAAPGTFDLTAAVSAASDQDQSDNTRAVVVTAVPGVDLVWSAAGSAVQFNAQTTITATLANTVAFPATSVTVTGTLAVGLRPDQATLDGSACTISGQTVSCPPRPLAASGTLPLALTLTGTASGNQQLRLNATANELDRAPADNQLVVAITVSDPQRDGGGGSLSWFAVAALLATFGLRRTMLGRRRPS